MGISFVEMPIIFYIFPPKKQLHKLNSLCYNTLQELVPFIAGKNESRFAVIGLTVRLPKLV